MSDVDQINALSQVIRRIDGNPTMLAVMEIYRRQIMRLTPTTVPGRPR